MPLALPPALPVKLEGRLLGFHSFNIQLACAVCVSVCLLREPPSPIILKPLDNLSKV